MANHFHHARVRGAIHYVFNRAGYEAFKNAGFDIISEDSLKNELLNLFEVTYPSVQKILNWVEAQSLNENQNDYIIENFIIDSNNSMVPTDYQNLLKDHYFISLLNTIRNQRSWMHRHQIKSLEDTQGVLQLIKDELER